MASLAQIKKMKELYTKKIEKEASQLILEVKIKAKKQRDERRISKVDEINKRVTKVGVKFYKNDSVALMDVDALVKALNDSDVGVEFNRERYGKEINFSLTDVNEDEEFNVEIKRIRDMETELLEKLDDWELEAVANKSELPTFNISF